MTTLPRRCRRNVSILLAVFCQIVLLTSAGVAQADLRLLMGGQARDVTTAEDLQVQLMIVLAEQGPSRLEGRLDGSSLSAEIAASGGPVGPCRRGHVCMLFTGTANGRDVGGRDVGGALTVGLEIEPGLTGASGVYVIGARRLGRFAVQRAED